MNQIMILNKVGAQGRLKASILCDKLVWAGIAHCYELVGECHTVTVAEKDVKEALNNVFRAIFEEKPK